MGGAVLLFFTENKQFDEVHTLETVTRILQEFEAVHASALDEVKPENKEKIRLYANSHLVQGEKTPLGSLSWQPSFAYTITKKKYRILSFDQQILGEEHRTTSSYEHLLRMLFDTLWQIQPSMLLHTFQEHVLGLRFRELPDLLGYFAYSEGLAVQEADTTKLFRGITQVIKPFVEQKEQSYSMFSFTSDALEPLKDAIEERFS